MALSHNGHAPSERVPLPMLEADPVQPPPQATPAKPPPGTLVLLEQHHAEFITELLMCLNTWLCRFYSEVHETEQPDIDAAFANVRTAVTYLMMAYRVEHIAKSAGPVPPHTEGGGK